MRVLLGPTDAAGTASAMRDALRAAGHRADVALFRPHPFGYAYDRLVSSYPARAREGLLAPWRYDVLHFQFGTTMCEFVDAVWARATRRPLLLMHYHGDDCRTPEIVHVRHPARARAYDAVPRAEGVIARRLRLAARFCHAAVVADLELASYLTGFRTVYVAPAPLTPPVPGPPLEPLPGDGPIVVHAPSDPVVKGTEAISAAIEQVSARRPLRVRMLRGLPRREVHAELARADIAIDQLNSETSGIFALEAMALGKPVLIEYRPDALASFARDTPLVRVTADTLAGALDALCADPARCAELGARGAEFVRRVHGPALMAPILERIYAHAWLCEPGLFEVTADRLVRIPWPPG